MIVSREDPTSCPHCPGSRLEQDPDVLDTWFSSGLWPFSTLGWPEETPDYKYFYPTSLLETGYDILFFWVARMIMDGLEFTGQVPFHTVYLHGLIRDEHGQKMSKTKGNVIDPLVVMDELGTDALRFTLLVGSTPGNDMNLSTKKVEANRNFANKLWNAGRFVIGALPQAPAQAVSPAELTLADRWIHTRLAQLLREVERLFENYQYGEAGRQIYEFFWSEFADWYLEISKLQLAEGGDHAFYTAQTLVHTLDTCLRLLHPFTPFVTEELWGHLKAAAQDASTAFSPAGGWEAALIVAHWPETSAEQPGEAAVIAEFNLVMDVIRSIRNVRMEQKIAPSRKIAATILGGDKTPILREQADTLRVLAGLDTENLQICDTLSEKPQGQTALVISGVEIYLPMTGIVDVAAEYARLNKELTDTQAQIDRLEGLLNSTFAQRAPAPVVEKERQKLAAFQETAAKLRGQLTAL
jgi:valyl-tRNA synthetase